MFEDFTFDQRVDSRTRPNPQRETALSPREVYAEWPPPARDAAPTTQCAGLALHQYHQHHRRHHLHPKDPVQYDDDDNDDDLDNYDSPNLHRPSETAVDSLARQLGRQTLRPDVQPQLHRQRLMNDATFRHPESARRLPRGDLPGGDIPRSTLLTPPGPTATPPLPLPLPLPHPSATAGPDFAVEPPWPHPRPPPPPPPPLRPLEAPAPGPPLHLPSTRAVRQNLIESMIINGDQCNVQNSEPSTPVPPPWTSLLTVDPLVAASDGVDAQMANSGFPLEVDNGGWGEREEGEGEPIIRLLSYRRAGAPTRIQKVGLGYRSSQDTALRCANLKKNVTKMRRRDRKPSRPTPGAAGSTAEAPST